jgi:hypothetical protein
MKSLKDMKVGNGNIVKKEVEREKNEAGDQNKVPDTSYEARYVNEIYLIFHNILYSFIFS